jgi:hypothetical protein
VPYTEDGNRKMGEIADATAADARATIVKLLNDEEFVRRLVNRLSGHRGAWADSRFEDQVSEFIIWLDFLQNELCHQA